MHSVLKRNKHREREEERDCNCQRQHRSCLPSKQLVSEALACFSIASFSPSLKIYSTWFKRNACWPKNQGKKSLYKVFIFLWISVEKCWDATQLNPVLSSAGPHVGLELCVEGGVTPFPSSTTTLRGDETGCMFFRLDLGLKVLKRWISGRARESWGRILQAYKVKLLWGKTQWSICPRLAWNNQLFKPAVRPPTHQWPPTLERVLNDLASWELLHTMGGSRTLQVCFWENS